MFTSLVCFVKPPLCANTCFVCRSLILLFHVDKFFNFLLATGPSWPLATAGFAHRGKVFIDQCEDGILATTVLAGCATNPLTPLTSRTHTCSGYKDATGILNSAIQAFEILATGSPFIHQCDVPTPPPCFNWLRRLVNNISPFTRLLRIHEKNGVVRISLELGPDR